MQDDTATFTAAFHVIKETCTFSRSLDRMGSKTRAVKPKGANTGENFQGKFVWKIEHFTRLKDILKKRKITGLCVKSKRFTVGGRDCRLIVYPRGACSRHWWTATSAALHMDFKITTQEPSMHAALF